MRDGYEFVSTTTYGLVFNADGDIAALLLAC